MHSKTTANCKLNFGSFLFHAIEKYVHLLLHCCSVMALCSLVSHVFNGYSGT